jgi:hypothetical protein
MVIQNGKLLQYLWLTIQKILNLFNIFSLKIEVFGVYASESHII